MKRGTGGTKSMARLCSFASGSKLVAKKQQTQGKPNPLLRGSGRAGTCVARWKIDGMLEGVEGARTFRGFRSAANRDLVFRARRRRVLWKGAICESRRPSACASGAVHLPPWQTDPVGGDQSSTPAKSVCSSSKKSRKCHHGRHKSLHSYP